MTEKEIEVQNVSFSYNGHPALESVSFSVYNRDFIGIIGPNGSGKTTLIKLLLGMFEPNEGKITIFDKPPSVVSRSLGYVPQNTNVNERFPITVKDAVFFLRLQLFCDFFIIPPHNIMIC